MRDEGPGRPPVGSGPSAGGARAPGAGGPPWAVTARVVRTRSVAPGVASTVLEAPVVAAAAGPLQFVQVRPGAAEAGRPYLGRPFSIADADPDTGRIVLVYRVVGPGTAQLAGLAPGTAVALLGPLGRPAPVRAAGDGPAPLWLAALGWQAVALRLLAARAVAAGVPVTVLLAAEGDDAAALADLWSTLLPRAPAAGAGAAGAAAAGEEGVRAAPVPGHLTVLPPRQVLSLLASAFGDRAGATGAAGSSGVGCGTGAPGRIAAVVPADGGLAAGDDPRVGGSGAAPGTTGPAPPPGSAGGPRPRLFAAGPPPFLRQVQRAVDGRPVDAFLVVDAYMPCGYGACLACAVPVRGGGGTRYVRACREGRWFAAGEVVL